ncbi:MAG: hypothetical protein Q7J85_11120 [Bacillota bacterium]|nr:hypothetical protein [Bacillota bacterium]
MQPVKRIYSVEWEKILIPVLFLLLLVLAFYNMVILENSRPGKMLEKTLYSMENNAVFLEVDIQERGAGYKLDFQGNAVGKKVIYGEISEYKLEVYKQSEELFIKDLKDGEWKKASDMGLESLERFLVSPFELLDLWTYLFKDASFIKYPEGLEKVILINVSPEDLHKTEIFQSYSHENPLSLECLIFIEEDKLFINQIILSLYDNSNLKHIVRRNFSFKPSQITQIKTIPASVLSEEENFS